MKIRIAPFFLLYVYISLRCISLFTGLLVFHAQLQMINEFFHH